MHDPGSVCYCAHLRICSQFPHLHAKAALGVALLAAAPAAWEAPLAAGVAGHVAVQRLLAQLVAGAPAAVTKSAGKAPQDDG